MCGFAFSNKVFSKLDWIIEYSQRRGPDTTTEFKEKDFTFIHHLLSITGDFITQPYSNSSGDILCIYNGEIYNHETFGDYHTDGECLIPAYEEFGEIFTRKLDGEFALVLVDFAKNKLILSSDTFGTKPIWMALEGNDIGIASYRSVLERLDFQDPKKIPPNTTFVYDLKKLRLLNSFSITEFNLKQFKDHYDDWISAFQESIRKRSNKLREDIFIGLSSGYDSGAIACELTRQNVTFKAYTIEGKENPVVLNARHELTARSEYIKLTGVAFRMAKNHVKAKAEKFVSGKYNVQNDHGSMGLSHICKLARKEGYKIFFSGQGADEIISDYGFGGRKIFEGSGFGGLFPEDLSTIFPYRNFFGGYQEQWIYKEESVAGSHGIETRYPFLDTACVQEFLWLTPELKNRSYKAPIQEYLERFEYPYDQNAKTGFSAHRNLVLNPLDWRDFPGILVQSGKSLNQRVKRVLSRK